VTTVPANTGPANTGPANTGPGNPGPGNPGPGNPGPANTGAPAEVLRRLRDARGFIFDMDGTLALGDRVNHGLAPLPGAVEILRLL
jgi:hypothetical protein